MTWVWFPWRRWQNAERLADEAEESLQAARVKHEHAQQLAAETRTLREVNGFTDMIRVAMGVTR